MLQPSTVKFIYQNTAHSYNLVAPSPSACHHFSTKISGDQLEDIRIVLFFHCSIALWSFFWWVRWHEIHLFVTRGRTFHTSYDRWRHISLFFQNPTWPTVCRKQNKQVQVWTQNERIKELVLHVFNRLLTNARKRTAPHYNAIHHLRYNNNNNNNTCIFFYLRWWIVCFMDDRHEKFQCYNFTKIWTIL